MSGAGLGLSRYCRLVESRRCAAVSSSFCLPPHAAAFRTSFPPFGSPSRSARYDRTSASAQESCHTLDRPRRPALPPPSRHARRCAKPLRRYAAKKSRQLVADMQTLSARAIPPRATSPRPAAARKSPAEPLLRCCRAMPLSSRPAAERVRLEKKKTCQARRAARPASSATAAPRVLPLFGALRSALRERSACSQSFEWSSPVTQFKLSRRSVAAARRRSRCARRSRLSHRVVRSPPQPAAHTRVLLPPLFGSSRSGQPSSSCPSSLPSHVPSVSVLSALSLCVYHLSC